MDDSNKIFIKKEVGLRRTGKSTRLIDEYIQVLFNDGVIEVRDHYLSREADNFLTSKIMRRLQSEHPGVNIKLNANSNIIIIVKTKKW